MRVVVSTIARFHHFDLARELQKRDALTAIFTGYPLFKLRNAVVDPPRIRSFPWLKAPYMALMRWPWFQRNMDDLWSNWAHRAIDAHVARNLPDCDLVVARCRIGVKTGAAARRRPPSEAGEALLKRFPVERVERLGRLPWSGVIREMSRAIDGWEAYGRRLIDAYAGLLGRPAANCIR